MEEFNKIRVGRFWDRSRYEFEGVNAAGRSGGLLSIWDPQIFQCLETIKSSRFLVSKGKVKDF